MVAGFSKGSVALAGFSIGHTNTEMVNSETYVR